MGFFILLSTPDYKTPQQEKMLPAVFPLFKINLFFFLLSSYGHVPFPTVLHHSSKLVSVTQC